MSPPAQGDSSADEGATAPGTPARRPLHWSTTLGGVMILAGLILMVVALVGGHGSKKAAASPTTLPGSSASNISTGSCAASTPGQTGATSTTLADEIPPPPPIKGVTYAKGRAPLCGFGEVQIKVKSHGKTHKWCVLVAATEAQQQRGLMTVTDKTLGGYDGMYFAFPQDMGQGFYMRNTPMPLSIAYIGSNHHIIKRLDMTPCGDVGTCPTYQPSAYYRTALEVPQGGLDRLGVDDTATVEPDGSCSARAAG